MVSIEDVERLEALFAQGQQVKAIHDCRALALGSLPGHTARLNDHLAKQQHRFEGEVSLAEEYVFNLGTPENKNAAEVLGWCAKWAIGVPETRTTGIFKGETRQTHVVRTREDFAHNAFIALRRMAVQVVAIANGSRGSGHPLQRAPHGDKESISPIQPFDGWSVQSSYGTLRTHGGVDLVRLEDVHAWLCRSGQPAKDAVYKIFSPFYMACLSATENSDDGALSLPGNLYVANASSWPNGLLTGAERSRVEAVKFFASAFPDLGHVRFSDGSVGGLIYSIAEGALRVWRGVAELNTDHLAAWKDRQERESDGKYGIKWPKDDDLRKLLGRVAVPIETAHELWGWGSVVEVVPLRSVSAVDVAVPDRPAPLTAQAIKDGAGKNKRGEWLPEAKALMVEASNKAKAGGEKIADVAATFGLSRQAFSGAVVRPTKGTRSKVVATSVQVAQKWTATR